MGGLKLDEAAVAERSRCICRPRAWWQQVLLLRWSWTLGVFPASTQRCFFLCSWFGRDCCMPERVFGVISGGPELLVKIAALPCVAHGGMSVHRMRRAQRSGRALAVETVLLLHGAPIGFDCCTNLSRWTLGLKFGSASFHAASGT